MIASPCSMLLMLKAGTPYPCSAAWSRSCRNVMRAMIDLPLVPRCGGRCAFSKGSDPRQSLAFEPFEKRAASSRDVSEAVCGARGVERGDCVPATRHGHKPTRAREFGGGSRERIRCRPERLYLKGAERTVPEQGAEARQPDPEALRRPRADVEYHHARGNAVDGRYGRARAGLKYMRHDDVSRQHDLAAATLGHRHDATRGVNEGGLRQ